jgi:hypothetical protein
MALLQGVGCSTTVRDMIFAMQACGGIGALHRSIEGVCVTTTLKSSAPIRFRHITARRGRDVRRREGRGCEGGLIIWSMFEIDMGGRM